MFARKRKTTTISNYFHTQLFHMLCCNVILLIQQEENHIYVVQGLQNKAKLSLWLKFTANVYFHWLQWILVSVFWVYEQYVAGCVLWMMLVVCSWTLFLRMKNVMYFAGQITVYFWHQIVGRMQGEPEVSAGDASSRLLISKHFKHLKSFAYYIKTQWLFDFHHIQLDVNLLWPTLIMFKIAALHKGDESNENKTTLMFLNVSFIHG